MPLGIRDAHRLANLRAILDEVVLTALVERTEDAFLAWQAAERASAPGDARPSAGDGRRRP